MSTPNVATASDTRPDPSPVPRRRGLSAFLASEVVSTTGTRMSMVAVPWFVLVTTGSAALTGLVAFAETLPLVLVMGFGGPVVDRPEQVPSIAERLCPDLAGSARSADTNPALAGSARAARPYVTSGAPGVANYARLRAGARGRNRPFCCGSMRCMMRMWHRQIAIWG